MRHLILFLSFLLLISVLVVSAEENDGIPDNCTNRYGEFYRQDIFPRYEPQNSRLILTDWATGNDVLVLAENLADTLISGWSVNCQYLAVSTGTMESRATAVYDTLNGAYIGEVPDARFAAHRIAWGPGSFLVVETRNGGILWNVPLNQQYQYDTGFNTTTYRNFSQLRWDVEQQLLIANLAVGGRMVIDLDTGNLTTIDSTVPGEIIAGGESFYCATVYNGENVSNARRVYNLRVAYAPSGGVIYLGRGYRSSEILETLMADVDIVNVRLLGWSANCRYLAASVLVQAGGYNDNITPIYETWIWEYETKRLIGKFEDARSVPHPISWDTAERHVLVQTRFGAYLWDLTTNERILVTDTIAYICGYRYSCSRVSPQSFHDMYWDAGREQLLAVPVDAPNVIIAYDVNTGAEVERITVVEVADDDPVQFITSGDSRLIIAEVDNIAYLINRDSGIVSTLELPSYYGMFYNSVISPDNRYFVTYAGSSVYVWDLANLSRTFWQFSRYIGSSQPYFVNNTILVLPGYSFTAHLNILTGEITGLPPEPTSPESQTSIAFTAVEGTSGSGTTRANWNCPVQPYYSHEERQLFLRNMQTDERTLIADNLNRVFSLEMSPDCQTFFSRIQLFNDYLPYTGFYRSGTNYVFWDVASGHSIITIEHERYPRVTRIYWSPDSDRVLLRYDNETSLLNIREQTVIPLPSNFARYPQVYWDYARGVVYASNNTGVVAIDLNTGEERLRFTAGDNGQRSCGFTTYPTCWISFADDMNWIFIYGYNEFAVWNINTLEHYYLPIESANGRGAMISPDGHYLIISRTAVRVWDLWNLSEDYEARDPIATYGVGNRAILSIDFVDNMTLEVLTSTDEGTVSTQYAISTGVIINQN